MLKRGNKTKTFLGSLLLLAGLGCAGLHAEQLRGPFQRPDSWIMQVPCISSFSSANTSNDTGANVMLSSYPIIICGIDIDSAGVQSKLEIFETVGAASTGTASITRVIGVFDTTSVRQYNFVNGIPVQSTATISSSGVTAAKHAIRYYELPGDGR